MSKREAIIEAARWSVIFKRLYIPYQTSNGAWFPKYIPGDTIHDI